MERAGVFRSNRSQAVRLPKAVALPESVKQVDIVVMGRSRLISPVGASWDSWFSSIGVTADFMQCRDQPADQERLVFSAATFNE
jgi:antitoxin VapB